MNYKMMGRFNALILALEAAFMLPAFLISIFLSETASAYSFLITMGILLAVSALLAILSKNATRDFYAREGLICVGSSWILLSLFGCLPFVFSGVIPNFVDALFETVSGFTTTGSSILTDLDLVPRGIMYWRCFSNWLGGMGVLVFLLAVVPVGGQNEGFTMHLLRAESPGPDVGKMMPRMRQTTAALYLTYIGLSLLNLIFLLAGKMSFFDALCTTFSTAGTGGFGVYNDSMAGFSPYIQWVCITFLLLYGINFSCYYLILLRRFRAILGDEELKLYLGLVLGSVALIVWNLRGFYETLGETVRHSFFQVASIITTAGFATTDFDLWPSFSKAILVILMIFGACAGSTGGGLKCARALLLFKSMCRNISLVLRPQKVKVIRVNGKPVDEKILSGTGAYFFVYMLIAFVSFLILSFDGFSFETNLTAAISCLNNIGPGLGMVGPTGNYASFSVLSKLVLIFDMLAGRLEIFPILVLFIPHAWKRG